MVASPSDPELSGEEIARRCADLGARLVLTEGGPHLFGRILEADRVDELFLTLAPQLVGRSGEGRLGLVEGLGLPAAEARWQDLVSLRRSGDHLFLRYRRTANEPS